MPFQRWLLALFLFAIIGGGSYWLWQNGDPDTAPQATARPASPVVLAPVARVSMTDRIESLGTLRANESIDVVSEETGIIEEILFAQGQQVEAGAVLLRLDSREEQAELAAARAELAEARKQYERLVDLAARNVATAARLDEQTAALRRAEANVKVAEAALAKRTVRAPFSGRLGIRQASPGALAGPGLVITTLDDLSVLKLDFGVPEPFFQAIAPGMAVNGRAAAFPGTVFTGEVVTVDSRIDQATRSFQVQAQIPNPELTLRPGMLLTVDLFGAPRQTLQVPEEAIQALGDDLFVFVVVDGVAQRRSVELGTRVKGAAEVVSGLRHGEQVIVRGLQAVRDGSPVRVLDGAAVAQMPGHG